MPEGIDYEKCVLTRLDRMNKVIQLKWLNENPVILAYMQQLGMAEAERVYGALAVGFPDTEDGLPVRTALLRTGNVVTVIE